MYVTDMCECKDANTGLVVQLEEQSQQSATSLYVNSVAMSRVKASLWHSHRQLRWGITDTE